MTQLLPALVAQLLAAEPAPRWNLEPEDEARLTTGRVYYQTVIKPRRAQHRKQGVPHNHMPKGGE